MKTNTTLVAAAIVTIGYYKYLKFEKFIDNLQIDLKVLEVKNGFATVTVTNKNTLHIPYELNSMSLILEKKTHAAINTQKNANLLVLPKSNYPITFQMLENLNEDQLQRAEIALDYNFYGFSFKRLYRPKKKYSATDNSTQEKNIPNRRKKASSCGCNKG